MNQVSIHSNISNTFNAIMDRVTPDKPFDAGIVLSFTACRYLIFYHTSSLTISSFLEDIQ